MPVVPTEQNKVGIAGVTGEKLAAGDYSGSGLQAVGAGLDKIGDAVQQIATTQEATDDAKVKQAYSNYAEAVRPIVYSGAGAFGEQQGDDAIGSVHLAASLVHQAAANAGQDLNGRQRRAYDTAIAPRIDEDLRWIYGHAGRQARVAQQQQSQRVIDNSVQDAVSHFGSPAFTDFMATGLNQIDEQASAGGWPPEVRAQAQAGVVSKIYHSVIDLHTISDPVLAAGIFRDHAAQMAPEHRAQIVQTLRGPFDHAVAVANVDSIGIFDSPTAPYTPPGDLSALTQRMQAISGGPLDFPGTLPTPSATTGGKSATSPTETGLTDPDGAKPGADLPGLVQRYRGDAAKVWAASMLGADALDALVKQHGATWFGALPEDTRHAVSKNMALLEAATSPRRAPAPEDREAFERQIDGQDWTDEEKQNARAELQQRIDLETKRTKQSQDAARETGFALKDQLGPDFTSINQIPPEVRRNLDQDTLDALTRQADRNVHPVTVPPDGDVVISLNRQAATDPDSFVKQDLRLLQDEMTPAEYASLVRTQKGLGTYPPSPTAMTQRNLYSVIKRLGLDGLVDPDPSHATGNPDLPSPAILTGNAPELLDSASAVELASNDGDSSIDKIGKLLGQAPVARSDATSGINPSSAKPTLRPLPGVLVPEPIPSSKPTPPPTQGKKDGVWLKGKVRMAGNLPIQPPEKQDAVRAQAAADLRWPQVRAFLRVLAMTEGTDRSHEYNTTNLMGKFNDMSAFPYGTGLSPRGMFQIAKSTYDGDGIAMMGLSDFSPRTQNLVAVKILRDIGVIDDLLRGDIDKAIFDAQKTQWSSLPQSKDKNYSSHFMMDKRGNRVHQPSGDYENIIKQYNQWLQVYKENPGDDLYVPVK